MKNKNLTKKSGYLLVEAVIYIGVLVLLSAVILQLILTVFETNRRAQPLVVVGRGAVSALEAITREIRIARSFSEMNSLFDSPNGYLELNKIDSEGQPKTIKFYLENEQIKMSENGNLVGPLTPLNTTVKSLTFVLASSSVRDLISIETEIEAGTGDKVKNEKFYTSVGLRIDK